MFDVKKLKFSGVRVDNGEICEGYYFKEPMFNGHDHKPTNEKHWIREYNKGQTCIICHEVHPDSVKCNIGLDEKKFYEVYSQLMAECRFEKVQQATDVMLFEALTQAPDLIIVKDGEE